MAQRYLDDIVDVLSAAELVRGRARLYECRYVRALECFRAVEVILSRVARLSLPAALAAVIPRNDVNQQVLNSETTVTLADEAGHAEVARPDAVEANLVELIELRAADDVDPVRVRVVLEQTGHRSRLAVVDPHADRRLCGGRRYPGAGWV